MAIGGSGTGRERTSRGRVALSEINVTPFVDVMLVLLIMFMATAPLMQQGIEVDLPRTSSSGLNLSEKPFILVISADQKLKSGGISLPKDNLSEKLRSIFESRKNKQVYVQADRKVDYGFVAEVIADIRKAGIFSIGLVTIPKD